VRGTSTRRLRTPEPLDRAKRMTALVAACRAARIPVTPQRMVVLRTVLELDTHPTADEIHARLARKGARISRATVFRTLDSLETLGLVGKTCHPGRSVRYDRLTMPHHHLVCLRCDAMVDFVDDRLDRIPMPNTERVGFQITDHRVQVRGLCSSCAKRKPPKKEKP